MEETSPCRLLALVSPMFILQRSPASLAGDRGATGDPRASQNEGTPDTLQHPTRPPPGCTTWQVKHKLDFTHGVTPTVVHDSSDSWREKMTESTSYL